MLNMIYTVRIKNILLGREVEKRYQRLNGFCLSYKLGCDEEKVKFRQQKVLLNSLKIAKEVMNVEKLDSKNI